MPSIFNPVSKKQERKIKDILNYLGGAYDGFSYEETGATLNAITFGQAPDCWTHGWQ